jgi:fumarate reductase subunit C
MLALITTLLAGFIVFLRSGLVVATASIFLAYAAFAAYAYFRSRMWMKDPAVAAAIAEGRQPSRAIMIERTVAAIVIPAVVAYIPYALLV